jgi:hypothetical protein
VYSLGDSPASAYRVLGLKVCTARPSSFVVFVQLNISLSYIYIYTYIYIYIYIHIYVFLNTRLKHVHYRKN